MCMHLSFWEWGVMYNSAPSSLSATLSAQLWLFLSLSNKTCMLAYSKMNMIFFCCLYCMLWPFVCLKRWGHLTSKASISWSPVEMLGIWMVVLKASNISISCRTSFLLVVPMMSSFRPCRRFKLLVSVGCWLHHKLQQIIQLFSVLMND